MNTKDKGPSNNRLLQALHIREGGLISWRFLAVLSLAGCIAIEILFNILPIDHNTLLLYWFYPASLMTLTQLYYSVRFTKHAEIRFLFVYLCWMCLTILLNHSRAHMEESYRWFACTCTTLFLCFSLPYAFSKQTAGRVMTALAIATVLAISLLSIVSLIAIYFKTIAAKFPTIFEGISFYEGRLYIDNHPNRSAPAQALAVVLTGYLLAQSRKNWQRIVWALLGFLCFVPLALTVSRTAIIGAGIAVGFEVFVTLRETLRKKTRAVIRIAVCTIAACAALAIVYKGAELVGQANNAYLARTETAIALQEEASAISPAEEPAANESAISPTEEPAANESAVSPTEEPAANENMISPTEEPAADENTAPEVVSRDLSDADSFNGRTDIWLGVWNGLLQNPKILAIGTGPLVAGDVMSPYFPVDSPIGLFHNSLLAVLVSFGMPGLLLTIVLLVIAAVSAVRLSFGTRKNSEPLAMRLLPAILIFTLAEGMMEDFLFAYQALSISWIWFMVAAGFVVRAVKQEPAAQKQGVQK